MFPALTGLMLRTDSELTVRQRPDGSYQTVAGPSIASMHALNMRLAHVDSGLLQNMGPIWCLVIVRASPRVQHIVCVLLTSTHRTSP